MPQTSVSAGRHRSGAKAQQQEFGRQGAAVRGEEGIDPGGVGVEPAAHRRGERGDFRFGEAIEAEHPHLPVDRDGRPPENFREAPGAVAPHQLHLEQAVLGMRVAEPEGGILVTGSGDQRNAVAVAGNRHIGSQPLHHDPSIDLWQRGAQIQIKRAAEDQEQQNDAEQNAADHHRRAPTPTLSRLRGRERAGA